MSFPAGARLSRFALIGTLSAACSRSSVDELLVGEGLPAGGTAAKSGRTEPGAEQPSDSGTRKGSGAAAARGAGGAAGVAGTAGAAGHDRIDASARPDASADVGGSSASDARVAIEAGPVDPCTPNRCEHGGRCVGEEGGHSCTCPPERLGPRCELLRFNAIEPLSPDPPGGELQATAISRDGVVVVGFHGGATHNRAFRWTIGGAIEDLGALQPTDTNVRANAVNRDGSVIVGYSQTFTVGAPIRGFRWTAGSGMEDLGLPTGSSQIVPTGVSADGNVVVGDLIDAQSDPLAFRWTKATGIVTLGPGYAAGTSADGAVVVGVISGEGVFRWTKELGATLLTPAAPRRTASGTNGDGSIIIGRSDDYHAFRWDEASGFVALGEPSGASISSAMGTSADGSVIVGTSSTSSIYATVWVHDEPPRLVSDLLAEIGLDLTGWTLEDAVGVSADGKVIAGNGVSPQHVYEAWVVRLP